MTADAQIEYLELRFRKKTKFVQKKFMFSQVFQSGENYTDQIRLSFREMVSEIIFSDSSLRQNNRIERK